MRAPVLTIRRDDLVREGACDAWLAFFDSVCDERDTDRATGERVERGPLTRRRDGSTRRRADWLRVELTPLAQVWLSLPLGSGGSAWAWMRARGVVGAVCASCANLRCANLSDANLRDADLSSANLSSANLHGANLSDANLRDADLSGADLRGADLRCANLSDANLRCADLRCANLRDAVLSSANLSSANLRDAVLSSANLSSANLHGALAITAPDGWRVVNGRLERV